MHRHGKTLNESGRTLAQRLQRYDIALNLTEAAPRRATFDFMESAPEFVLLGSEGGVLVTWLTSGEHACACQKFYPHILVMQSAKDRTAEYEANRLDGAGNRRILVQGQVRTRLAEVAPQQMMEMADLSDAAAFPLCNGLCASGSIRDELIERAVSPGN